MVECYVPTSAGRSSCAPAAIVMHGAAYIFQCLWCYACWVLCMLGWHGPVQAGTERMWRRLVPCAALGTLRRGSACLAGVWWRQSGGGERMALVGERPVDGHCRAVNESCKRCSASEVSEQSS